MKSWQHANKLERFGFGYAIPLHGIKNTTTLHFKGLPFSCFYYQMIFGKPFLDKVNPKSKEFFGIAFI